MYLYIRPKWCGYDMPNAENAPSTAPFRVGQRGRKVVGRWAISSLNTYSSTVSKAEALAAANAKGVVETRTRALALWMSYIYVSGGAR